MSFSGDNVVGAYEAKTHFSSLLERVIEGEEITITRHGQPVARMVPMQATTSPENRAAAIRGMRQIAGRNRLGDMRIKDLIAEGRK